MPALGTRVSTGIFIGLLLTLSVLSLAPFNHAAAEEVVSTIGTNGVPWNVDVNQKTGMVYATDFELFGGVFVIDGATDQIVGNLATGLLPLALSVDPSTNMVYVADYGSSDVAVIDGSTNKVVAQVEGVLYPSAIMTDPATDRVYVGGAISLQIAVIDGATNSVTKVIQEDCGPVHSFALDPVTDTIYATTSFNGFGGNPIPCVLAIDGQTGTVSKEIFLGRGANPSAIAVDIRTNMVYVGDSVMPVIYGIDGNTDAVAGRLTVQDNFVDGLTIDAATGTLYASHWDSNRISVFDLTNGSILASIPARGHDTGIMLDSATDKLYVTDASYGELYVVSAAASSPSQGTCGAD